MENISQHKTQVKNNLIDVIKQADTLIERCRNALRDLNTLEDQQSEERIEWFMNRNENLDEGFKHIELF